ncbi:hypothetical protein DL95DRAFT_497447 [Leptodontidium sp. 2 PMI_412]|nr:hypothetical protein DL95DRAFT_497447 [Leptodontidium sp. 2 PMI_412]
MSNWFADKDHPENETKWPFVKEIFKMARLEERYKAGDIGKNFTPMRHINADCLFR